MTCAVCDSMGPKRRCEALICKTEQDLCGTKRRKEVTTADDVEEAKISIFRALKVARKYTMLSSIIKSKHKITINFDDE